MGLKELSWRTSAGSTRATAIGTIVENAPWGIATAMSRSETDPPPAPITARATSGELARVTRIGTELLSALVVLAATYHRPGWSARNRAARVAGSNAIVAV